MKEKILVTGGTGYIGSHTVVELINSGFEVVIADNLANSSEEVLEGIAKITGVRPQFVKIDCASKEELCSFMSDYPDIRCAIHFAAYKAVGESVEKPLEYYRNNLDSLINVIDILRKRENSVIVFSSSCTVYGDPAKEDLPVSEDAPIKESPSPYGKTKQMSEQIIKDSVYAYDNLSAVSLRYFNPVGAHPSALIGELPLGVPQNLMPVITQCAAGVRPSMKVFGTDYNTRDGSCIRDYIYVCDLAKAHVAALGRMMNPLIKSDRFEVFNIGTGKGLSVLEIIGIFEKVTGIKVPHEITGRREGDAEQLWADPRKSNELLGWSASTPVEDVVASAWRWEKRIRNIS